MKFNPFEKIRTVPPAEKPVEEQEISTSETEFRRGLKALVEELGGRWQLEGMMTIDNETVDAFYVIPDDIERVEQFLADKGYEPEEDIDEPEDFAVAGKYRRIFFKGIPTKSAPEDQKDSYFFRVSEKK